MAPRSLQKLACLFDTLKHRQATPGPTAPENARDLETGCGNNICPRLDGALLATKAQHHNIEHCSHLPWRIIHYVFFQEDLAVWRHCDSNLLQDAGGGGVAVVVETSADPVNKSTWD